VAKQFAISDDVLSLGTKYEQIRISTQRGGDWDVIYDKSGGFLQRTTVESVHTIRVEAYADSNATIPARGDTKGGFIIDDITDTQSQRGHRTVSITATIHVAGSVTSTLKR
jgi:phosphatidate phosphatase APP1